MNKLRKRIKEEGVTYSVDKEDLNDITPELERAVKDGDTVEVTESDEEEIESLYSDADDRAIEYGVKNEAFDRFLNKLEKDGNAIKMNITESVNPRMKKSELINYFKNKNNE